MAEKQETEGSLENAAKAKDIIIDVSSSFIIISLIIVSYNRLLEEQTKTVKNRLNSTT